MMLATPAPAPVRSVAVGYVIAVAPTRTRFWMLEGRRGPIHSLVELDPATLRIRSRARTSVHALMLAATPRTVWIGRRGDDGRGSVVAIDARSRVRVHVFADVAAVGATAVGSDAVIVDPRVVERLSSSHVIWKRRLTVGLGRSVTSAGRYVFVAADAFHGRAPTTVVYRLDAATGRVEGRMTGFKGADVVAASTRSVWVLGGDALYMVPRWGAKPRVLLRQHGFSSLALQDDTLWVGSESGLLYEFDDRGALRGSFHVATAINAVARGDGGLWIVDGTREKLVFVRT